jgi:hypothetical protein
MTLMTAISDKNRALVFRALQEKKASSNLRVKVARHVINMKLLEREIATYNLDRLQKAASDGHSKIARMKFAALVLQHQVEKEAFARALLGGLASGAIGLGRRAIGGAAGLGAQALGTGASAIGAGLRAGVTRAPLMATGAAGLGGVYAGSQLPSREEMGNTLQKRVVNPAYYGGARMYNNATLPFRKARAAVGGFGQGLEQGGRNLASMPGRGLSAVNNMLPDRQDVSQSLGTGIGDAMRFVGRQFTPSARPSQPQARPNPSAPFADPVSRLPEGVPQNDEPA